MVKDVCLKNQELFIKTLETGNKIKKNLLKKSFVQKDYLKKGMSINWW